MKTRMSIAKVISGFAFFSLSVVAVAGQYSDNTSVLEIKEDAQFKINDEFNCDKGTTQSGRVYYYATFKGGDKVSGTGYKGNSRCTLYCGGPTVKTGVCTVIEDPSQKSAGDNVFFLKKEVKWEFSTFNCGLQSLVCEEDGKGTDLTVGQLAENLGETFKILPQPGYAKSNKSVNDSMIKNGSSAAKAGTGVYKGSSVKAK